MCGIQGCSDSSQSIRVRSHNDTSDFIGMECENEDWHSKVPLANTLSLIVNMLLALSKIYAAIVTGSLAVLSSLVDSLLDLVAQGIFWYTDKAMHQHDHQYPQGRRRLAPVGVIVAATLMGLTAFQVVQASTMTLIHGLSGSLPEIYMNTISIVILCVATVLKFLLWVFCRSLANVSENAAALAQDHWNDVGSNLVATVTSLIASKYRTVWYLDPSGAILISSIICYTWVVTAKQQIQCLVGFEAHWELIEKVKEISSCHHPDVQLDRVTAYHFGTSYLVEDDILLPATMSVGEAYHIAIELQHKLEEIDCIERAYVHIDYVRRNEEKHKDPTKRRASGFIPSSKSKDKT